MKNPWPEIERTICRYVDVSPAAMYQLGVGLPPKHEAATLSGVYPEMRVFAADPHPEVLLARCREPHYEFLLPVAVGRERCVTTLQEGDRPDNSSLWFVPGVSTGQTRKVIVLSLDDFDELAGEQPDILLWMDIEGSELAALQGGRRLMRSGRVKWINLEVREAGRVAGEAGEAEIAEALEEYGYRRALAYNSQFDDASRTAKHRDEIWVREQR